MTKFIPTTGALYEHIKDAPECQEFLTVYRTGQKFRAKQTGRHRGTFAKLVLECTQRAGKPYTLKKLLGELDSEAAKRELHGERASPIEKVDRVFELVTVHDKGRKQLAFRTVRGHLTAAKKIILAG